MNLPEGKKKELFHSVNQGETVAKGRLRIYDNSSKDNVLLHNYISHTESIDFPYIITPDRDALRCDYEKEHYIPAVYFLPLFKKVVKYYGEDTSVEEYQDEIFTILDLYITNAQPKPFLRKQYFSILGTIVEKSKKYEGDLADHILKVLDFDYTKYGEVSKAVKETRSAVVDFVFSDAKLIEKSKAKA